MYYISRGRLKPANRSFNTTSCEYEITLNEDSEVEPVSVCVCVGGGRVIGSVDPVSVWGYVWLVGFKVFSSSTACTY